MVVAKSREIAFLKMVTHEEGDMGGRYLTAGKNPSDLEEFSTMEECMVANYAT